MSHKRILKKIKQERKQIIKQCFKEEHGHDFDDCCDIECIKAVTSLTDCAIDIYPEYTPDEILGVVNDMDYRKEAVLKNGNAWQFIHGLFTEEEFKAQQ